MQPAIHISGLTKSYADVEALRGIDLTIASGAFFGLLGPNGAGKTTTINILAGLCKITSGSISVFGKDLLGDYRACRRLIGLVPQEFNFDIFAKLKQILVFQGGYFGMSPADCRKRADELLEEFDLLDKQDAPMRHLSGGMKRRAIICRALMHRPKVLILDEPTAGVDVDLRRSLWLYLQRLNKEGTTILLTTHYIEEAEALCDEIAIINEGNIVTVDTTRNLVARLRRETITITAAATVDNSALDKLEGMEVTVNDHSPEFTVSFERSKLPYQTALERIMAAGITIENIKPLGNKLEQVFVDLTRNGNK
jgi:ABC-2 type transport system ATP-binding protein